MAVTFTEHTKIYRVYHWQCPRCKEKMNAKAEPSGDSLLCWQCYKWSLAQEFNNRFASLENAVVVEIEAPSSVEYNDEVRSIRLRDSTGQLWLISGDTSLFVYRINEYGDKV